MALTILLLVIFSCVLAVFNYKNKYGMLFATMGLSIALFAITIIMEIQRISNYNMHRIYFFSWLDTKLYLWLNQMVALPITTILVLQNIGYVLFQIANVAFIYFFGKYTRHSVTEKKRFQAYGILILTMFILLYFVFYHPEVGYRIFLAQFIANGLVKDIILSGSWCIFIMLSLFNYICPLIPIAYLLVYYKKGYLTIFFEQVSGLALSLFIIDILFFVFVTERPFVKWNGLLRTGFWRGLSIDLIPNYNLSVLPLLAFCILLIAFILIRFQITNYIEVFKEHSIRKNVKGLHDNLRDVLHSEKNVIFNLKILAEGAMNDYGTPQGMQKLERLVSMCNSHLESLTQSINNIKEANIKTNKRNFVEAIEAALRIYSLPKRIQLVKKFCSEEVFCNYDLYHMTQVIINLLDNSVAALSDKSDAIIEISLDISDYWVIFSIQDNGIGISPKVIKKIHKPYYSTKSKQNNWGIGLSYVKKVIEAHFGYVKIRSQQDKWTKVEFLLMNTQNIKNPTLKGK